MRSNDQKYVPDPRSRSPGINQYSNMASDFQNNNPSYTTSERLTYGPTDFGRMNSGGGIPFTSSSGFTQNTYERDFKSPPAFSMPPPHQHPSTDFRQNFDSSSVFVPRSKYLQEEMKNNFSKDFSYPSGSAPKPMQMNTNFQNMPMPQPQSYDLKPEPVK